MGQAVAPITGPLPNNIRVTEGTSGLPGTIERMRIAMKIMSIIKKISVVLVTLAGLAAATFALFSFKHRRSETHPMVSDLT